jgi:aryl-alcohol dehydrogenase-like predicted oxidoreductase
MEKRRLGRTGHMSTIGIFGSAALSNATQAEAAPVMEKIIEAGVNHIDISPMYGLAEERVGPWMPRERARFFLGCKTILRTKEEAAEGLRRSLETLQTDRFDLFQFHEVVSMEELDKVTGPGGALEAVLDARDEGLTDFIGICGHGWQMPAILLEALRRFDFDTVLFPINRAQMSNVDYRRDAEAVLRECRTRDVGVMIIKSMVKGPWDGKRGTYETPDGQQKQYNTWYEPYANADGIQESLNFVLSYDVTGICTPAEPSVLPLVLDACEGFTPLSATQQEAIIGSSDERDAVFDQHGPIMI